MQNYPIQRIMPNRLKSQNNIVAREKKPLKYYIRNFWCVDNANPSRAYTSRFSIHRIFLLQRLYLENFSKIPNEEQKTVS